MSEIRTEKNHCEGLSLLQILSFFPFVKTSFSPDGRYVTAGSTDGSILVWDLFTSEMVLRLNPFDGGLPSPITSVNWSSPKGELLSVDKKGKCIIWS